MVVDGESMPLGIWTSSFDSATIVSKIYEILAQDSSDSIADTQVLVLPVLCYSYHELRKPPILRR